MVVVVFFIFTLLAVVAAAVRGSPMWLVNNSLYRAKDLVPVPDELTPAVAESIARGSQMALEHCQSVFKWERWNCPTSSFLRLPKQDPNRETAFAKAILAAGVVYSVTKDCSKGLIPECRCYPMPERAPLRNRFKEVFLLGGNSTRNRQKINHSTDWTWGGCSDDVSYALEVAKKLFDKLEKGLDAAAYVGRHNGKVGREMIVNFVSKRCECHGMVSSCSMQTCWMELGAFEEVVMKLKEKYRRAERVAYEAVEEAITLGNSARQWDEEKIIPVKKHSLVYLVQSPDYCVVNAAEDVLGTKGRQCSRDASEHVTREERKSCKTLCRSCGYKVRKFRKRETRKCNCSFTWCCDVKCDTCVVDLDEYFCH
ncbi:hypothetical protein NQ315_015457 [Exocentrus adspersus]|uniref:Protein Wnt n=1 Tax=Exocentrus adspersus TaxID=1586481 RepID=A0AAV8VM67_9CUCU|nr:hypothetical protein NQ315_015457 [Exocentrus adspersus]